MDLSLNNLQRLTCHKTKQTKQNLNSVCDLKAEQVNMYHSLIWQFILYKFELDHNAKSITRNICFAKGEGAVNNSTVTRWFTKFRLGFKNLSDQTRPGRQINVNITISTLRLSDDQGILQSSVFCHLDTSKSIRSSRVVPHVNKIL